MAEAPAYRRAEMDEAGNRVLAFGDCELDCARRELRRAGKPLELQPTPLRVLLYLAEHRDRTVSRRELLDAIWPEVVVGDEALTTALAEVRHAVGDDGTAQRVIRTQKGAGYRFVAEVRVVDPRRWPSPALEPWPERAPAIAVLPFENLSSDPEQAFFAAGIADDLITRLASFRSFPVIARSSSFSYRGENASLARISAELGARYLLEGSVRRIAERIRVSARLIDAQTTASTWTASFDSALEEVFAAQDDMSASIAAAITSDLARVEAKRCRTRDPRSLGAWSLYQLAVDAYHRYSSEGMGSACELLEQAVAREPDFAAAHAYHSLAIMMRAVLGEGVPARQVVARAREAAQRATELDPLDYLGRVANSLVHQLQGEREKCLEEARLAEELNPSAPGAWQMLAYAQWSTGDASGSIASCDRIRRIDPRGHYHREANDTLMLAFWELERFSEGLDAAQHLADYLPRYYFAHVMTAVNAAEVGEMETAQEALREARSLVPGLSIERVVRDLALRPVVVPRFERALRAAGLE